VRLSGNARSRDIWTKVGEQTHHSSTRRRYRLPAGTSVWRRRRGRRLDPRGGLM